MRRAGGDAVTGEGLVGEVLRNMFECGRLGSTPCKGVVALRAIHHALSRRATLVAGTPGTLGVVPWPEHHSALQCGWVYEAG